MKARCLAFFLYLCNYSLSFIKQLKMRYFKQEILAGLLMLSLGTLRVYAQFDWHYTVKDGKAVTEVPVKADGQQTALNLVTPKLNVVRVGFVGLGMRGPGAVERWTHINGIEVKALCDHERNRAEACQHILRKAAMPPLLSMMAKKDIRLYASVRILISFILQPTGYTTSSLLSMHSSMVSMWL